MENEMGEKQMANPTFVPFAVKGRAAGKRQQSSKTQRPALHPRHKLAQMVTEPAA